VYNLLAFSTGSKLHAIDQEVRSSHLIESGWISKGQSVGFAVAFVLDEDFTNKRAGFDILALDRVTSLLSVRSCEINKTELSYLDHGGGIHKR
jgi:hypothetical protein